MSRKSRLMSRRTPRSKYPPFPGTNWDYGAKMAAAQQLIPPNRCICIYCHGQALTEAAIIHATDCPAKPGGVSSPEASGASSVP
jgi:hypothetical protein